MTRSAAYLGWLLVLALAAPIQAQYRPTSNPTAPAGQLPPLLYVKLLGPKGMQVTFFREDLQPHTFDVPCSVGLRPGYSVRLAVSGVPGHPGAIFFPTLEVHGSLALANPLRSADFPAALVFTGEDFARSAADVLVKKVIVLERPDNAVPVATAPDAPFEILIAPNRNALWEAQLRGQPLLVLQMGERQLTRAELANATGTVLLPGEKALSLPRVPPWLAWSCFPVVDPRAGLAHLDELMVVPDGGDVGLPAGFNRQGKLRGLDPSDTVAEYFDSHGQQKLAVSNRVALCIPRFIIIKTEAAIANQVAMVSAGGLRTAQGYVGIQTTQPALEHSQKLQVENMGTRQRAGGTEQAQGTAITGRINNLVVIGAAHGVKGYDAACALTAPEPPDGPLLIIKWPDRFGALVGDTITFTLKFTNSGGQPINNVVVSDSLTNRFEYIPGSAKTNREAIFTTQPNDAGSLVLRWEITGTLQPHETGLATFQVRVR